MYFRLMTFQVNQTQPNPPSKTAWFCMFIHRTSENLTTTIVGIEDQGRQVSFARKIVTKQVRNSGTLQNHLFFNCFKA